MDKPITVTVNVVLKGEARGVKQQGGIVDFVQREIEIECLPGDIPESIEVDVTELMLNDGVRLRDVAKDVKWTAVSDLDTLLVHVVPLRVAEEAPAAEAAPAATAEPEVIKKGKTEKEEEKA
jgi:large subunit ribosomal protein L25